jgi:hypothetical protein
MRWPGLIKGDTVNGKNGHKYPIPPESEETLRWRKRYDDIKAAEPRLRERRTELLIAIAMAEEKFQERLNREILEGRATAGWVKSLKIELSLADLEAELDAIDRQIGNLPVETEQIRQQGIAHGLEEQRSNLAAIAKEQRAYIKRHILPVLRALEKHLPELERMTAEAHIWADRGSGRNFWGYHFLPGAPTSILEVVKFALGPGLDHRREHGALVPIREED